jgi:hypothetical protein
MTKRKPYIVNRWRTIIYKGDTVRVVRPRGGEETGKVVKLETRGNFASAYGPRVVLESGAIYSADDVVAVTVRGE